MSHPYVLPIENANKAHTFYENGEYQKAFDIYVTTIRDFLKIYKSDTNEKTKAQVYPIIKNAIGIAERIKLLLQMPSIQKDKSEGIKMIGGTV